MKYFFDTEFIEHAGGIQLVSLGIEAEDGRTFYAESTSFNPDLANSWVKEYVLSKLKYIDVDKPFKGLASEFIDISSTVHTSTMKSRDSIIACGSDSFIKSVLLSYFISEQKDPNPEFYAYYAAYDWVVFARLFGRLVDKPKHFPMWVIDLKQMMWERGLSKEWKQEVCPDSTEAHNALADAQWNKKLHSQIILHSAKS